MQPRSHAHGRRIAVECCVPLEIELPRPAAPLYVTVRATCILQRIRGQ